MAIGMHDHGEAISWTISPMLVFFSFRQGWRKVDIQPMDGDIQGGVGGALCTPSQPRVYPGAVEGMAARCADDRVVVTQRS